MKMMEIACAMVSPERKKMRKTGGKALVEGYIFLFSPFRFRYTQDENDNK